MRILNTMRIGGKSMGGLDCTLNGAKVIYYYATQRHRWVHESHFLYELSAKLCSVNPTDKCLILTKDRFFFFLCRVNKPFFPNPTAPLGCNWTSLEINLQLQSERDRWVWHHSHPLLLHVIPQLKWTTPLSWILHRLRPKGNVTLSWIPPSSAQPSQSQRHRWVGFHTPFPPKGNVGFALLSQPLPSSPYMAAWCSDVEMHASPHTSFLHARALFLKQYTKQTINTIFTIFPTTTT